MTSVLILGAGASRRAGYPTAQELLPRIRSEASTSQAPQFREAWNRWEAFLDTLPPVLDVIRHCSNPEIVLSLPDLFDAAAEFEDESQTLQALHHLQETGESTVDHLHAYFASPGRKIGGEARAATAQLAASLDWYFSFRHDDDSRKPPTERDYLRKYLSPLARGYAVITFNWDTLTERTLAEDGRWCPVDGYGFRRDFVQESANGVQLPILSARPSEVVVLKLHGSYGWRCLGNHFFLDGPEYLAGLAFPLLQDGDKPANPWPSDPVFAYPSFFKHLARPVLAEIWTLASAYLSRANFVEVIGYSLPASDSAVRALLLPLIQRLQAGAVRVVIHDQSLRTLERWKAFLGLKAEFRHEVL